MDMDCEAYRAWVEQAEVNDSDPTMLRRHAETCPECQAWHANEAEWSRLFATVPERQLTHSLWPGVWARMQDGQERAMSFSAELMALGRLLVPSLAVLVLALAGVALWSGAEGQVSLLGTSFTSSLWMADLSTDLEFINSDADTILQQWGGAEAP